MKFRNVYVIEILEFGTFEKLKSRSGALGHDEDSNKKTATSWIGISYLSKNMKWKFGNFCIFK